MEAARRAGESLVMARRKGKSLAIAGRAGASLAVAVRRLGRKIRLGGKSRLGCSMRCGRCVGGPGRHGMLTGFRLSCLGC